MGPNVRSLCAKFEPEPDVPEIPKRTSSARVTASRLTRHARQDSTPTLSPALSEPADIPKPSFMPDLRYEDVGHQEAAFLQLCSTPVVAKAATLPVMTDIIQNNEIQIVPRAAITLDELNAAPPKRESLVGLPAELRCMIFKEVLTPASHPRGSEITIYNGGNARLYMLGRVNGQLCRVSRQIYRETIALLYGYHPFGFLSREALMTFLENRTQEQLGYIQSVCMRPRMTDWTGAVNILRLPPTASLTVHWPIEEELWQALARNPTIGYRGTKIVTTPKEQSVIFDAWEGQDARKPSAQHQALAYTHLSQTFAKWFRKHG